MGLRLPDIREKLKERTLFDYLLDYYVIPKTGNPYSFVGHSYLMDIAKDTHHDIVIEKSAQCGASELAVGKAIWVPDEFGLNVVYAMPAMEQMRQFSRGRVHRVIAMSPHIRSRVSGAEKFRPRSRM